MKQTMIYFPVYYKPQVPQVLTKDIAYVSSACYCKISREILQDHEDKYPYQRESSIVTQLRSNKNHARTHATLVHKCS